MCSIVSDAPAVTVSHLSKRYRILDVAEKPRTAAEAVVRRVRHPLRGSSRLEFPALDDISFSVPWGTVMGIVGRNGAGKSTLLKILTRITAPSAGKAVVAGRVGSLLEVGTGFHPELTGRENVYLNGTLLGMRKREIARRFDEIVEFAGVEKFLDTQVKRFSTGMYVRLAFGVAAHLESEILAVDEVLAVGDAEFQAKCIRKLRDVAQVGRAVFLVSHQVQTVATLATSAMYLDRGRLLYDGGVSGALEAYKQSFERPSETAMNAEMRPGTGYLRLTDVAADKDVYDVGEEMTISFGVATLQQQVHERFFFTCAINDENRFVVAQCDSRLVNFWVDPGEPTQGVVRVRTPWLKPGTYSVDMTIWGIQKTDEWVGACSFQVLPVLPYPAAASRNAIASGAVLADFDYQYA